MLDPNIKLHYYKVWYKVPDYYPIMSDDLKTITIFITSIDEKYVLIEAENKKQAEKLGLNYIMSTVDQLMKKYVEITSVEMEYGGY